MDVQECVCVCVSVKTEKERSDKMNCRQLCGERRNVSVCVSAPAPDVCSGEFRSIRVPDYVCLDNRKDIYSSEIRVRHMRCEQDWCVRRLFGLGILHLSCQSPREAFAWEWWMCSDVAHTAHGLLLKANEWAGAETGEEGASGAWYAFNPWMHLLVDEEKWVKKKKNRGNLGKKNRSERGKRWTSERMKIFEDSRTHGGGGHGELCVSVTGLRANLPFRY